MELAERKGGVEGQVAGKWMTEGENGMGKKEGGDWEGREESGRWKDRVSPSKMTDWIQSS